MPKPLSWAATLHTTHIARRNRGQHHLFHVQASASAALAGLGDARSSSKAFDFGLGFGGLGLCFCVHGHLAFFGFLQAYCSCGDGPGCVHGAGDAGCVSGEESGGHDAADAEKNSLST